MTSQSSLHGSMVILSFAIVLEILEIKKKKRKICLLIYLDGLTDELCHLTIWEGRFPGQWETGLGRRCCVGRTRRRLASHRRATARPLGLFGRWPEFARLWQPLRHTWLFLTKMPSFYSPASALTPMLMILRPNPSDPLINSTRKTSIF